MPSPLNADFTANSAENSGFHQRRETSNSVYTYGNTNQNLPFKCIGQNQSDHGSLVTDQMIQKLGKVERTLFQDEEHENYDNPDSQLGSPISLLTEEPDGQDQDHDGEPDYEY